MILNPLNKADQGLLFPSSEIRMNASHRQDASHLFCAKRNVY